MASFHSRSVFCVILVVLCTVVPILGKGHTVGGSSGWAIGMDYSTWTSGKTFSVGDTLVFNYGGGHTVDEVSASDYRKCTTGNAITSDSSGATTVALKTAGTHYFICGVPGHCGGGMKLAVTVAAAGSSTKPSSSETPSSGGTTTSPASGTTTTSPAGGTTTVYKPSSNSTPDSSSGHQYFPICGYSRCLRCTFCDGIHINCQDRGSALLALCFFFGWLLLFLKFCLYSGLLLFIVTNEQ
ncbi:BLUE COPPER PROTEIN-LIKE [Salix viminalis]|uniref:BLUE COPPER PROTEIN-LIKE n=1 Tax=Salix viminalis TaxID=40686 RepID=A0A9Q0UHX7_SALVM|nr:BLUE COPPER PROTEIN-LIKE [Salix viminalis]